MVVCMEVSCQCFKKHSVVYMCGSVYGSTVIRVFKLASYSLWNAKYRWGFRRALLLFKDTAQLKDIGHYSTVAYTLSNSCRD